jgi:CRP/FNR family transcriptional regulator
MKPETNTAAWRGQSDCRNCSLRHLTLFSELNESDFRTIHLPIEDLAFPKGAAIFRQGEAGRAVFTIRSGVVKMVHQLVNGAQRIVRLHRTADTIGLEATLGEPYGHDAVALQSALVCKIPAEALNRLAAETPRLHHQLMRQWHQTVVQADAWLTDFSLGTAKQRIARLFLYLIDVAPGPVCHFFRRDEVAAILGVTTETASRTVAELKREKVVHQVSARWFRCDIARLREIARN